MTNPDEIKNHALIAGGIGAFVRLAIIKPKSIMVGIMNVIIGAVCSWFFSPIVVHYILSTQAAGEDPSLTKFRDNAGAAMAFLVGFTCMWFLNWFAALLNDTKGNPLAAWSIIKSQISGKPLPQPNNPTDNTNDASTTTSAL